MRVSRWGFAIAALAMLAGPALAHHSKSCRPYTIEKVCWEKGRPCHLHMVYAAGHNPAGPVPDGYWYSAKSKKHAYRTGKSKLVQRKKRVHGVYATCQGFDCWYRHALEHRY